MITANPQRVALGMIELNKFAFRQLLDDPYRLHVFDNYDPLAISYVDARGQEVAKGLPALMVYMDANPGAKIFLSRRTKVFDLALEGGGAFGFAHLGTLHAMALRGIWFDRVSGASAGSIAAALVAAGYKVDLNYKTITDKSSMFPLEPSPENSLNQILFDDQFKYFTDFTQSILGVKMAVTNRSSFVHQLIEEFLGGIFDELRTKLANIGTDLQLTRGAITSTYLNIKQTIIDAFLQTPVGGIQLDDVVLKPATPALGPIPATPAVTVGSAIRDASDIDTTLTNILNDSASNLIDDLIGNTGPISDAIDAAHNLVLEGVMSTIVNPALEKLVVKDGAVQHVPYGLFRLLEFGGFWDGNYVRDWLERHLQQLVPGSGPLLDGTDGKPNILLGGAPANAVLFKDLKIDLCIVGADMGPVDGTSWNPEPVYFSKRTTPEYPVAEAVRRSVSLPLVFIPRKINDGYGNNPPDTPLVYTWSGGRRVDGNLPSLTAGTYKAPEPSSSKPAASYDNNRHHDHLIFDGGVFVNLPVAVFRDPSDFVFDYKKETKPIVISNINGTIDSSVRPDDMPLPVLPEPFRSFKAFAAAQAPTPGATPQIRGDGFIKVNRAGAFILSFMITEHQETEINSLLKLVPNSLFVDIHARDPHATISSSSEFTSDGRIDAGEFNMSKTAKKWLVKNGFDGAQAAFAEFELEVPALEGKLILPKEVDPYLHILEIKSPTANGLALPPPVPRCKEGDNPYTGGTFRVDTGPGALKVGSEIGSQGYLGIGGTWVKMANNQTNRTGTGSQFLAFETNLRTRVLLAIDGRPSFATTANGWQLLSQSLRLTNQSGTSATLNVFSKMFEKGRIAIPGPGTTVNNQFAYAVLVCPV